jgi:oligoribonuclease
MLVWIDTETTGLNPRPHTNDKGLHRGPATLLEVACIVTDDEYKEIARYQAVTDEARRVNFEHVEQVVLDMHAQNGLWGESLAVGKPLDVVDEELAKFLDEHAIVIPPIGPDGKAQPDVKPQLAGSTVSFDRGFIEKYLPKSNLRLHYRNVDVTTMNEIARRTWRPVYEARPNNKGGVAHRAMPDIEESLRVGTYYAGALTSEDQTVAKICAWIYSRNYDPSDTNTLDDVITAIQQGAWK